MANSISIARKKILILYYDFVAIDNLMLIYITDFN